MSSDELTLYTSLLGIAAAGILAGSYGAGLQFFHYMQRKWEIKQLHEVAIIEDGLYEALDDIIYSTPVKTNYRHNIHCPKCGRFSKRVMGMDDVVECKHHGVQVRWKDIPVDWAYTTQHRVTLTTEPIPIISEVSIPSLLTQPIDIIVPDDLSELEELGAVI